jgi:uncharacterized membrane protein YphA (DoxX/SURF4 family)
LLLRSVAGLTALLDAAGYVDASAPPLALAAGVVLGVSGALLLLGFLTPIAAGIAAVCLAAIGLSWLPSPSPDLFATGLTLFLMLAVTVAVSLLGPGAFSLDGHLFGRREIVLPRRGKSGREAGTLKRDTQ